jgi:serine phosphatase RsbU (regulator of sigma subunit)
MIEKPVKPYPPYKYEYDARVERRYIYADSETLREDHYDEYDEEEENDRYPKPEKPVEEIDLGWLLKKIPEGIKPEQIKIEFGYNASSMSYEDHYIRFYYEEKVSARKAEYKAAMAKYEKDLKQYEKDLEAYEEAKRQQEIAETEAKLERLKGKKL